MSLLTWFKNLFKASYSETEMDINKVMKYEFERVEKLRDNTKTTLPNVGQQHQPREWGEIVEEANKRFPDEVGIEDILTKEELEITAKEIEEIEVTFSKKTGIINKLDLTFLAIATGLQVAKSLLFPYVAQKLGYGEGIDKDTRLAHDDSQIKKAQKKGQEEFENAHKDHGKGKWLKILTQPVPYDTLNGSAKLGLGLNGNNHREKTLGHDPVLGWLFGTANILTDVMTLKDFRSFRVERDPEMEITGNMVDPITLFKESYEVFQDDHLNLPAAICAQGLHLKSDEYTKAGLPVPVIEIINSDWASELYKNGYDKLCFTRDLKIVAGSAGISILTNLIIGLVHGLFRPKEEDKKLYEVRTRKILLISNSIASASTIINTLITKNPRNLDIGTLLVTVGRLFLDLRFMAKVKKEFIKNELDKKLEEEIAELDKMYERIIKA